MASSKQSTVVAQFHCGETTKRTWKLKNWSSLHKILTSKFSCQINVGNAILRFFLKPLNLEFQTNETDVQMRFYSLWVELLSKPMEMFCIVYASVTPVYTPSFEGTKIQTLKIQSAVSISEEILNQSKQVLVCEKFIFISSVYTDFNKRHLTSVDPISFLRFHDRTPELDIDIAVTLFNPEGTEDEHPEVRGLDAQNLGVWNIANHLFLNTELQKFYDVQLKMKDNNVLQAHKIILAAGSPVFLKMLTSEMKESTENLIEIPDIGSQAMKVVLHFIYTNEVDEKWKKVPAEMVYAAAKYDLPKLLEYLNEKMLTACNINNVVELFRVAKLHNLENAMKQLTEYTRANTAEVLLGMDSN